MSFYNLLFGVNSLAPLLKAILQLDVEGGTLTGRFRDIYLEDDGSICLYTRNGGNNRDCWEQWEDEGKKDSDSENCGCPGCTQTYNLPKHPNYLRDEDDDFDNTYCYTYFSVPEEFQNIISAICEEKSLEEISGLIKAQFPHLITEGDAK